MSVSGSPPSIAVRSEPFGSGGIYRVGLITGTIAAGLAANAELVQLRFLSGSGRKAAIHRISVSIAAGAAATAVGLGGLKVTVARGWTGIGTGGTRYTLTGNSGKLKTTMAASEVTDIGIATTGALVAGTKVLDAVDLGSVVFGIGTGAITTSVNRILLPEQVLFSSLLDGGHPLRLESQEGFVIRNGATALPTGLTWNLSVNIAWTETSII